MYQQTQRWFKAGCFETMGHDLRALLRLASGREPVPTATILDSRTLQSTPESGARAGYDGAKRHKGSKVHAAVDTLGHLRTLHVTPANGQDRDKVAQLARRVHEATGLNGDIAYAEGAPLDPLLDAGKKRCRSFGLSHESTCKDLAAGPLYARY